MRRQLALVAFAAALFLLSAPGAEAASPIPGTPVTVIDLGPSSQIVSLGAVANFSWGIYNGGPQTYTLIVSANATDPSFVPALSSGTFVMRRDDFVEVNLTVTTPSGEARTTMIHVWFNTTGPVVAALERNVTVSTRAMPASVDVLTAFAAIGAIIAIGFAAVLIFERTRIPDLLILIVLGLLLGPVALTYFGISFVSPGVLEVAAPYFTALALMMILFDGGLNLRLAQVTKYLGMIGIQTGTAFVLTVFGITFVTMTILGYPLLVGLLVGAILGGTSSEVVIGIARALRVSEETKVILTLEAVLTDILTVVTVLALIELIRGGPGASAGIVFASLGMAFLVSTVLGLAFGVGWLALLSRFGGKPFAYMLTIAALFVLYAVSVSAGGNGAMASFVFGLVLGNHRDFERFLRRRITPGIDERIKQFHSELSFVVRTFFFVFLGIVFTFQFSGGLVVSSGLPSLSPYNGTFTLFLIGIVLIFVAIVLVRFMTSLLTAAIHPKSPAERRVLWSLMGRGLTPAVLASLPFTIPAFTQPVSAGDWYYATLLAPYHAQFLNIVFFIILLTVAATTIGVASSERLGLVTRPSRVTDPWVQGFLRHADLDELLVSEDPPPPLPEDPPPP